MSAAMQLSSGAVRNRSGSWVPTTRTRSPGGQTWRICTMPSAGWETQWRCSADTAARCERVLPYGDPLTQAVRQSLANIGEG